MRVLLVEDEVSLSSALASILKKNNYTVDCAFDGNDAQEAALTNIYDVIILDLLLPGKSGFEVLEAVRKEGITTPVIILTAKGSIADKTKGFELGADDYLTKPFLPAELMLRIKAVSKRNNEQDLSSITVGDLVLNTKACSITCPTTDKTIQLSAKEFHMLEYMMRNPGILISKDQFIEKVWGYDSNAEYNSVEVYISFIRKKMGFTGCKTGIKAVRGMGYSIEENGQ